MGSVWVARGFVQGFISFLYDVKGLRVCADRTRATVNPQAPAP